MIGQHAHQGRRTEQAIDAESGDGLDQSRWIGPCRSGRVHVRDDAGQPECRIEQGKGRKGRHIDATGRDRESLAQQFDLRQEMPMSIDHALGYAGRARGEQDRGDIIAVGGHGWRWRGGDGSRTCPLDLGQTRSTPEPAPTDRHPASDIGARPAEQQAGRLGQGNADEGFRPGLGERRLECAPIDSGIDQNRHGARLEQGEHHGEELRAGPNHHSGPGATADAMTSQTGRDGIGTTIELPIADRVVVAGPTIGGTPARTAQGDRFWLALGHPGQGLGDVARGHQRLSGSGSAADADREIQKSPVSAVRGRLPARSDRHRGRHGHRRSAGPVGSHRGNADRTRNRAGPSR